MVRGAKVLQLGINDLGVIPRDQNSDYLPSVTMYRTGEKNVTGFIRAGDSGEFNVTGSLIASAPNGDLYDESGKILEWRHSERGGLIVESYTDKQVNLFADIKGDNCLIRAKGPLFIKGKIESSTIAIVAKALWLAEPLNSHDAIHLIVRQGVGLLAPIKAQDLVIKAPYVQQEAELHLSGQLDVSTQCFNQGLSAKTTVNSLRLRVSQCQMRGELTVAQECFLNTDALVWGDEKSQSRLRFLGGNHIHAVNLLILGNTEICIGGDINSPTGVFTVDQALLVSEGVVTDICNTELSAKEIDSQGKLAFYECIIKADIVHHKGILEANYSGLNITQKFTHDQRAVTELKNSNLLSPLTIVLGGQFTLNKCDYRGQSCNAFAGSFELKNESKMEINYLWLLGKARSSIKDCKIKAESMVASAEIFFENVDIETDYLKAVENKTTIKNSKIKVQSLINLEKNVDLAHSQLYASWISFKGELIINGVKLEAADLEINSEHAAIDSLYSSSERVVLQGSKKADEVMFRKSVLTTNEFSCLDHITLENTAFYGISKESVCHELGSLKLIGGSKFITPSQVKHCANSYINLDGCTLHTGSIYSKGGLYATDSNIVCTMLSQKKAPLELESSKVSIEEELNLRSSEMKLNNNSLIKTSVAKLEKGSEFKIKKDSVLEAASAVTTSFDSRIGGHESKIFTRKFTARGQTELCSSLLSAEELEIYNKFAANNKSKVVVEELITVAKKACAQFSDSTVASNNIQIFGEMVVGDTVVAAKNKISVWSPATMTLKPNSLVLTEDKAVVRGTLVVEDKAEGEEEKKKASPQLRVNGQLCVTEKATLKGNTDLLIEADQYLNSGSVNLSGDLTVRGKSLYNFGSFKANSIYLGFDDKVVNSGSFSAKKMTVNSNFMNFAGEVYVKQSLSIAGFYGLNFGLIAANNYCNTTLLSVNAGLVAPNLSADPRYIFSLSNVVAVAKIAATTLAPGYYHTINLAFMAPSLVRSAYSLYNTYKNFSLERFRTMRRHEWMPQICQFKGVLLAGWYAFDSCCVAPSELATIDRDFSTMSDWAFDSNTYSLRSFKTAASKIDWVHGGARTAGAFLGNYADNSLVHINLGASLAPATFKRNLFNVNVGAESSLLFHIDYSPFLFNSGWSGGGMGTFLTDYTYNTGTLTGFNQFTFKAQRTVNTGVLEGNHVNVSIEHLSQEGRMALYNGQARITEFTDAEEASTQFTEMVVSGNNFDSIGHLDAETVQFSYAKHFITQKSSAQNTKQVMVQTPEFSQGGQLDYQGEFFVRANKATLEKGASIVGKQTDKKELFVPKAKETDRPPEEQPLPTLDEQTSEQGKGFIEEKVEGEFKPQNVFTLQAKEVNLDGKLAGGDYTSINGKPAEKGAENSATKLAPCEFLKVGDSAAINLTYGAVASEKSDILGQVHLKNFDVNVGKNRIHEGGRLELKESNYAGKSLGSEGIFKLDKSTLRLTEPMNLSNRSEETFKDSTLIVAQFIDNSQLSYQGEVAVSTGHYEHGGRITKLSSPWGDIDDNLFHVKAKTVDLHGSSALDNAIFAVEHFPNAKEFVSGVGQYKPYSVSRSLKVETQDPVSLDTPLSRNCDLTVKAKGITMTATYNRLRDLGLISTGGDVSLLSNITNDNLYVKSAGNILTNHTLYSNGLASFEAAGGFYNLGGFINPRTVVVKAREVKNISAGSYAASLPSGVALGGSGLIHGREETYLEATHGTIENHGGAISSGKYTQLIAQGNVLNACNVRSHSGVQIFDGGLIAGGSGVGTDGVGLYVKAKGAIISDASGFVSHGSNYLEADQGFLLGPRQHTAVSAQWTTKKWYGKTTQHIATSTTTKGVLVHSATGKNILVTEHGGFQSAAAQFSSPGGTEIYARDQVALYSLKSQNREYKSTTKLWGLSKHSTAKTYQDATPSLFIDNGVTRIYSSASSIDARGAYFMGAGDLDLRARGRIKFGADTLNHELTAKTRSLGISVPGMGAWQAWNNNGTLLDAVSAEDATLAKLNSMIHSNNAPELLANSTNLGINLYNTTNSLMRGVANNTLGSELLSRYGLGDENGFSPTVTLSMTKSKTRTQNQTQSIGGVNRGGNVYLEAGEGIDLENGVRVHAGGHMVVNAPELIATAAQLHSSVNEKTTSRSIGINCSGQLKDASMGYSHRSTGAINYVNAELSAGGNMRLHYQNEAMHHVVLDGARIDAGTLDANIKRLDIIDKQDTRFIKTKSVSASLSGKISAYKGRGDSAITNQKSGIHVVDGINTKGHSVHIEEVYMRGGEILTEGENKIQIDQLVSEKVVDHQSYSGVGISFNVNDLQRLAGQEATNTTGEQAIATAELTFEHQNYKAEKTAVIHGAQGTYAEINRLVGELHSASADGTKVIKNNELHLTLDIPVTNSSYLEKSRENIHAGSHKIALALGGDNAPGVEIPFGDEKFLPSRRKEEEEEEEMDRNGEKDKFDEENSPSSAKSEKEDLEFLLSLMPPGEQEEFVRQLVKVAKESGDEGAINPETRDKLSQNIKSAILQLVKAGAEEAWGQYSKLWGPEVSKKLSELLAGPDAASKINMKTYFSSRGIFITFMFNLGLKSVENAQNVFKEAMISTAGDVTFAIALRATTGPAAGPLGWIFVGTEVADTLLYNSKANDKLISDGVALMKKGEKLVDEGKRSEGTSDFLVGYSKAKSGAGARVGHFYRTLPTQFTKGLRYLTNTMVKNLRKNPPDLAKIQSVVNRSLFFPPAVDKKENMPNDNSIQPGRP